MLKHRVKKGFAWILICAVSLGMTPLHTEAKEGTKSNKSVAVVFSNTSTGSSVTGGAATLEPTIEPKEVITVTPFAGLWKYYGQKRTLIRDVHYSVSDENDLPDGVTLSIASEEPGKQAFVLKDNRTDKEKQEKAYQLVNQAPTYEIRQYHTNAVAKTEKEIINIEDRKTLTDDSVTIEAPKGYRISSQPDMNAAWSDVLTVKLSEGINTVDYYLASMQADETKKAIDTAKKTLTITADFTAPQITELSGVDSDTDKSSTGLIAGNEAGKFYYVVLPKNLGEEAENESGGVTSKFILSRVTSHYGIVGYGRVDGKKTSDFSFNGLAPETEYVIYSFMTDDAGNESAVAKSSVFVTDKAGIAGTVEVSGTPALDETLTAKPSLDSVDPGELTYQWYRIKKAEDAESFESVLDETGGADEDDLEADDEDDEDEDDAEDDEDDDTIELAAVRKLAVNDADSDDVTTIDGAALIAGATNSSYKITKADIGYRLICQIKAKNYSGYVAGQSTTYVPKLVPQIPKVTLGSFVYSNKKKLSSIRLPQRFNWVDNTIVPVYGNSGYRAKYVPEDTAIYRTVIVRVKVPVKKKALTKSMIRLKKKYAYQGKSIKGNETVKDGKKVLVEGKDYKATYVNNKNLGKASITIKGIGNYKGTKKATYEIVKRSVRSVTCHYKKTKNYTGRWVKPGVVLKVGKVKLKKNRDYTLVYRNNLQIGKASVLICGRGNYTGKRKLSFTIVPKTPKVLKLGKKKKSFSVSYSSGSMVHGYQIEIATSPTFSSKKTQKFMQNGNRFEVSGLKKGTYYIRLKAYYNKKKTRYYSGYTGKRKIKIKK